MSAPDATSGSTGFQERVRRFPSRFWSTLAVQLGKHAGVVSVVGLIITLVLGFGITQLKFATGQDSYLNATDRIAIDNVEYQKRFGGQAMLTSIEMDAGHTVSELFDAEGIGQFEKFSATVKASKRVAGVITPLTALDFSNRLISRSPEDPTTSKVPQLGDILTSIATTAYTEARDSFPAESPEFAARQADIDATTARVLKDLAGAKFEIGDPEWNSFLLIDNVGDIRLALRPFFPDTRHAQVIVRLVGNQSIENEGAASILVRNAAADLRLANATVTTTGAPVLLKDINDYLRGGMLTLGGIAVGIMVLILLVMFDVRWRLLPMLVILVGVVWAFGLAGYLGIPLTIVTIAGLPVMLGVGIDYAIQMHARVEEEVVIDRSPHPIQETSRNLGPALLVVTFDAVFAFLALRFAKVPMIRDFGTLLAVGISAICLCSIFMPLAALGIREFKSPTKGRDFREGVLGRLTVWLGSLPPWTALPLSVAAVAIFAGGAAVESKLEVQTDPIEWLNPSSQTVKDFRVVEAQTKSSSELAVFVRSADVLDDATVKYVHEFTKRQLRENPDVLKLGSSIETAIGDNLVVEGGGDVAVSGRIAAATFAVAPPDIQSSTVTPDRKSLNIAFLAKKGSLDERGDVVRAFRDKETPPDGIRLTPSGLAVVGVGLVDNLESNRILLTYLAILFVFLFLAVRLRSLVRSLLSLVPVLIATGSASLVAYAVGFDLSPMTAVGGPLVVAACTEFTSLILLRFLEERDRGLSPREAIDVAAARTGRAFIVSALTAIAGVAVISLSSLPLLRDFGRVVAMNVAVALISALVVLPPMLVWADKRNWVSRGMLGRKHDEPFLPTPPMGAAADG